MKRIKLLLTPAQLLCLVKMVEDVWDDINFSCLEGEGLDKPFNQLYNKVWKAYIVNEEW